MHNKKKLCRQQQQFKGKQQKHTRTHREKDETSWENWQRCSVCLFNQLSNCVDPFFLLNTFKRTIQNLPKRLSIIRLKTIANLFSKFVFTIKK